eukprot:13709235-Ditylum_brightwellii.AAC.1
MERSNPNACVDDGKEDVDNSDDDSDDHGVDSGDKHLTHLTQVESNVNLGVCDKHLTHIVKNTPESLISDVTGHLTHANIFRKMPVSKNVILWLRGGCMKNNSDSIDNGQKDNDEKDNGDTNNQSPSQG